MKRFIDFYATEHTPPLGESSPPDGWEEEEEEDPCAEYIEVDDDEEAEKLLSDGYNYDEHEFEVEIELLDDDGNVVKAPVFFGVDSDGADGDEFYGPTILRDFKFNGKTYRKGKPFPWKELWFDIAGIPPHKKMGLSDRQKFKTLREYLFDLAGFVTERVIRKKVWRNGRRMIKLMTDREGYKIVNGREVKMTPEEIRNRQRAAKKAARKGKAARVRSLKQTLRKKNG